MTGEIQDRAIGAPLGLVVGDALGTTLEFAPRDSQPPLTDMVGGGPARRQSRRRCRHRRCRYGQLAGALQGVSGIPDRWLERLAGHDRIVTLAVDLYRAGVTERTK
jgi:ADP-ribosylglycohydrolase